jgi:hypothetical protein
MYVSRCTLATVTVILGINWLDKYQEVISYDKRTVKLVSPLGKKGGCHLMAIDSKEVDPLDAIKVVSELNRFTLSKY